MRSSEYRLPVTVVPVLNIQRVKEDGRTKVSREFVRHESYLGCTMNARYAELQVPFFLYEYYV